MDFVDEIKELKKKIQTLEWDKSIGNVNFSKGSLLVDYKKRLAELEAKASEIPA